jgi:hypothetical protein
MWLRTGDLVNAVVNRQGALLAERLLAPEGLRCMWLEGRTFTLAVLGSYEN